MTVQRSSQQAESTRRPEPRDAAPPAPRAPAPREDVDRFRALLTDAPREQRQAVQEQRPDAASVHRRDPALDLDRLEPPPADAAAMMIAHRLTVDAPVAPPQMSSSAANVSAFVEMVEKHVRQMLVTPGGAREAGEVMLRLNDGLMADTDLRLSRVDGAWRLRAESGDARGLEALRDAAPELARRFEARALGEIVVDPVLRD